MEKSKLSLTDPSLRSDKTGNVTIQGTSKKSFLKIQGGTAQTGNLQEWHNAAGVVASIDKNCGLHVNVSYSKIVTVADASTIVLNCKLTS